MDLPDIPVHHFICGSSFSPLRDQYAIPFSGRFPGILLLLQEIVLCIMAIFSRNRILHGSIAILYSLYLISYSIKTLDTIAG
jgi:hypothetical protein